MRLDRNENADGKGKYTLVLLRKIERGGAAYHMLMALSEMGVIDWGERHSDSEFFLIRLKDKFAAPALHAYALAAQDEEPEFAKDVMAMAVRAEHHPNKKTPD